MPLYTVAMKRKYVLIILLILLVAGSSVPEASADSVGYIARGVGRTIGSVLEIPKSIIEDSTQIIFPLGIVTGTIKGATKMLVGTLGGVVDIARGAAPLAKYAVFFV